MDPLFRPLPSVTKLLLGWVFSCQQLSRYQINKQAHVGIASKAHGQGGRQISKERFGNGELWTQLSQDFAMQASGHSWLRKSPLTKTTRHWQPTFLVNSNQRKHLGYGAVGHSTRVTSICRLENLSGDITYICSSPISHILQTLDQILLLKGSFNAVGPLTLWHTAGVYMGQIGLQSEPGWICTCAPQNCAAVSKLTISSQNSPLYAFQSSMTLPFSPD